MNTLAKHEICSVTGGGFNLYRDPVIPERVLPAPTSTVGMLVPPELWPVCPFVPEPEPEWAS
jgi:hypothetical protein